MTALSDELTAASLTRSVRSTRLVGALLAFLPVYLTVGVWLVIASPDVGGVVVVGLSGIFMVGSAVVTLVLTPMVSTVMWPPGTRALLAGEPWRAVPVRVLNAPGTTLWLGEGQYVRVRRMPAAVREMVARAERVWVAGPDAKGRLVVRVDGLSTLWTARQVPPVEATAAPPTGQPIMDMWLGPATDRRQAVLAAVMVFVGVLELLLVVPPGTNKAMAAFGVGALAYGAARWLWIRRYRRLLPSGSWVGEGDRTGLACPLERVRGRGRRAGTARRAQAHRAPHPRATGPLRPRGAGGGTLARRRHGGRLPALPDPGAGQAVPRVRAMTVCRLAIRPI